MEPDIITLEDSREQIRNMVRPISSSWLSAEVAMIVCIWDTLKFMWSASIVMQEILK